MGVGMVSENMFIIYFLAVFEQPRGQSSRCQEGSNPTLIPGRGFPHEYNFPNKELIGERGSVQVL